MPAPVNDRASGPAKHRQQVEDAFARGQAALNNGDRAEAVRWLDRAHRLVPADATITLFLASATIGQDNVRAAALFAAVLDTADPREAWSGLATSRFLIGDIAGAAVALGQMLGRHACPPDANELADRIVVATGAPGWCGLTGAGNLILRGIRPEQVVTRIDGRPATSGTLPPAWPSARRITVTAGSKPLIGSPISPRAIGRVEGYAEATEDGLCGWAWCPGDPDHDPLLSIRAGRTRLDIIASRPAPDIPGLPPLARPRSFAIAWSNPRWSRPATGTMPIQVRGRDGKQLHGSPVVVDSGAGSWPESRGRARQPGAPTPARRPVALVLRARDPAEPAWIAAVVGRLDPRPPAFLIAPPGQQRPAIPPGVTRVRGDLDGNSSELAGHDLIVLDAGVLLPPDWLDRLRDAAYAAPDIGTVTPFSNRGAAAYPLAEGTALSWFRDRQPGASRDAGNADRDTTQMLDKLARQAGGVATIDIPFGGGPCLFIRGDCLAAAGPVLTTVFASEWWAETEFCPRARQAGWRHVALPGLFVGDARASSENSAALLQSRQRNIARIERRHPGFRAGGPAALAPAQRRLDMERWRAMGAGREATILITHDDGGGVERRIETAIAAFEATARRAVVLRPAELPGGERAVDVDRVRFPNLRFALPRELPALLGLLREAKPTRAELHHFLNHDPSIFRIPRALGIPYDIHVHDYAWFCPRIALVGRGDRYCGEPPQDACETCVAEMGTFLHEDISVMHLLDRSRDVLDGASRVVTPSQDAATRMSRHFPGLTPEFIPHEDDASIAEPPPIRPISGPVRICVAGAIGLHKGFDVLLACALDSRERNLDLSFVVAGTTTDDQRLIDTGRVFVTGPYRPAEAVPLIRAQDAALALLPSIWPETWSLGLTELWLAGLRVAAFDIGAPAERIRRTGRGLLLPPGLPAPAINDTLLNAVRMRSLLPVHPTSGYRNGR